MCIQWTRVLYSVVMSRQDNPPNWVSKFIGKISRKHAFCEIYHFLFQAYENPNADW